MNKVKYLDDKEIDMTIARMMLLGYKRYKAKYNGDSYNDIDVIISNDAKDMFVFIKSARRKCGMLNHCVDYDNEDSIIHVVGGSGLVDTNFMFDFNAKELDLSMLDTRNVESMNYMFTSCIADRVNFGSIDTSKVKEMCRMFQYCEFKELNISMLNTSNVEDMDDMFRGTSLDTLNFIGLDTSKVSSMCGMFDSCKINELTISNIDVSNVIDMSYMFSESKINKLNISNIDTSNVKDMHSMFESCVIPKIDLRSFNVECANIDKMFCTCKSNTVDISSFSWKKIEEARYLFAHAQVEEVIDPDIDG
ncbi:MAG: BspA family leucine-rich repeat surface protein [Lachnospiraceae bacterium]|nr:BspA family leucine-rich repeat surface protein [Lachnospiraceae bacterium]